jgi:hypothetical protein
MHARIRFLTVAALLFSAGAWLADRVSAQPAADPKPADKKPAYRLTGPFAHDNLTIFLVHGEDRLKGRKYMMLAEALEKKLFIIHETQNVNNLTMENMSTTDEVLILAGDILKGGQQDRIAQYDQFVPPKSGKVGLTVFCVERTASRWMQPLTEQDKTFSSSPGQICTNNLRLAARANGSQGEVWDNVRKAQKQLSDNAGKDVKAKESDSSLALSLQTKEVLAAADKYVAALGPVVKDKADALGYVFAINGKVYASDIYCSPVLFQKAWPRLIQANAIEAFADLKKDMKFSAVALADVTSFLDDARNGKDGASKKVAKGTDELRRDSAKSVTFGSMVPAPTGGGAAPGAEKKEPPLELRSTSIAK